MFLLQKVVFHHGLHTTYFRSYDNNAYKNAGLDFVNFITDNMLAPIAHQPVAAPLKTSMDQSRLQSAERKLLPIGSGIASQILSTLLPPVKTVKPVFKQEKTVTQNALSASKIFPITFSYSQRLCYTKVLKVVYRSGESIYKVVLRSEVSPRANVCWLQLRREGWCLLLGQGLDESLLSAITSAILSQE